MKRQTNDQKRTPAANDPSAQEQVIQQKLKSEQNEVAGRHKNTGQKDHKGAR
jgi:hypothetical protein